MTSATAGASGSTSPMNPLLPEDVESTNLTLVVMMGLPASGKSTLANQLVEFLSKFKVVIVSFDDFVPLNVQARICQDIIVNPDCIVEDGDETRLKLPSSDDQNTKSSMSTMKLLRAKFVQCVDTVVKYAKDYFSSPNPLTLEHVDYISSLETTLDRLSSGEWVTDESFLGKTLAILDELGRIRAGKEELTPSKIVLIVDDNNYYHSMRNSFYQIAKVSEVGFCLINCKVPVKTCVQRNSARPASAQVPHKIIVEMGLKYEEPNALQNSCDMYCVEVSTLEKANLPLLEQVIYSSFGNIPKKTEDRSEEIERERRICSENEVHQADLVLRKWFSKKLNMSCFSEELMKNADGRKKLSKELNSKKKITLEKLRSGEFQISFNVSEDVDFRNEIIGLFETLKLE